MERTLVLIKPDGVAKGLCGDIISRFEKRGFKLQGLKYFIMTKEQAAVHYIEHQGKPFYNGLINFITSGPIVAMVISGENAVKIVRTMMGTTNPVDSMPGTIRGDYALSLDQNIIHGSDSVVSAEREVIIYFNENELVKL